MCYGKDALYRLIVCHLLSLVCGITPVPTTSFDIMVITNATFRLHHEPSSQTCVHKGVIPVGEQRGNPHTRNPRPWLPVTQSVTRDISSAASWRLGEHLRCDSHLRTIPVCIQGEIPMAITHRSGHGPLPIAFSPQAPPTPRLKSLHVFHTGRPSRAGGRGSHLPATQKEGGLAYRQEKKALLREA